MRIAVWDTYVKRDNGLVMHFDILVPDEVDEKSVFEFGNQFLNTKGFGTRELTSRECRLCHIEEGTQEMITSIKERGYFIIEMENCL